MRRPGRAAVVVPVLALALAGTGCPGGEDGGDPVAFCRHVSRLGGLVTAAAVGPEEITDVPAARRLADDIATTATALRRTAPGDIGDAARALADVTGELATELARFYQAIADDEALANDPGFLSSFDPLTDERRHAIEDAGKRVRPWIDDHCEPAGPTTSSPATASTPATPAR